MRTVARCWVHWAYVLPSLTSCSPRTAEPDRKDDTVELVRGVRLVVGGSRASDIIESASRTLLDPAAATCEDDVVVRTHMAPDQMSGNPGKTTITLEGCHGEGWRITLETCGSFGVQGEYDPLSKKPGLLVECDGRPMYIFAHERWVIVRMPFTSAVVEYPPASRPFVRLQ